LLFLSPIKQRVRALKDEINAPTVTTPSSKKVVHQLVSITQSILNGFSKFLHWHTLWKIWDKRIIKDFSTPKTCRCTTLWNINYTFTSPQGQGLRAAPQTEVWFRIFLEM